MNRVKSVNFIIDAVAAAFVLMAVSLGTMACPAAKEINNNKSSETVNPVNVGKQVSLFDDRISFIPPADFKLVTREEIASKLAENEFPQYIFANADRTAFIKIELIKEISFSPEELPKLKNQVEKQNYSKQLTSEIITINSRQWFHFEAEDIKFENEENKLVAPVPTDDETPTVTEKAPTHYHQYSTSFNDTLLHFVFVSDVKVYSQAADAFMKSIRTIKMKN